MFLKNRNISSKIKRSKVTDYAALISYLSKAMLYTVDFEFYGTELQQNVLDRRAPKTSFYSDIVANFG